MPPEDLPDTDNKTFSRSSCYNNMMTGPSTRLISLDSPPRKQHRLKVDTPSTAGRTVDTVNTTSDDCSYEPTPSTLSSSSPSSTPVSTISDDHIVDDVNSSFLSWTSATTTTSTTGAGVGACRDTSTSGTRAMTFKIPLPSPSRPGRLHKQYAKRLNLQQQQQQQQQQQRQQQQQQHYNNPARQITLPTGTSYHRIAADTVTTTTTSYIAHAVNNTTATTEIWLTPRTAASTTAAAATTTATAVDTATVLDDSMDTSMTDDSLGHDVGGTRETGSFVKILPPPGIIRQRKPGGLVDINCNSDDDDDDDDDDDEDTADDILMTSPLQQETPSTFTMTPTTSMHSQMQQLQSEPSFFFRPSPIVKPSTATSFTGREDGVPSTNHDDDGNKNSGSRRRFFFPDCDMPPSGGTNSSDSAGIGRHRHAEFVTPRRPHHINHQHRHHRTVNGTRQSLVDLGVSDRFIPSRATSSTNSINLWAAMNAASTSPSRRYSSTSSPSYSSTSGGVGVGGSGDGSGARFMGPNDDSMHSGGSTANDGSSASNNIVSSSSADDLTASSAVATSINPATGRPNVQSSIVSQQNLHNVLLRSELLGENISPYAHMNQHQQQGLGPSSNRGMSPSSSATTPFRDGMNRLRFQSPRQAFHETVFDDVADPTSVVNNFSLTPFGSASSQRLMSTPQKHRRKIAKVPFKVLDAPALQDDFYLNLVDWSSQNVLAVGLGSCVYLWSACTSKVTKLCDLNETEDVVTSVSWAQRGTHLAVGTNKGEVQLWDTIKVKKVRTMGGHSARVGTLAWTGPMLASGSRDRLIYLRDVRAPGAFTDRLSAHRQEVCGLRWSFDEPAFLASGGNDNQLHVVDSRNPLQPVHRFTDHTAAVKAIAWSPHQHGLLASGGGTADRCIRFWNTLSGAGLNCVDTGSQVCNLAWSRNCNEIVSTHGYSLNQIVVWRYPTLSKVTTLTGHTYRVLYLAVSPDGSTIVTGAGDETLRFWQVFPGPRSDGKNDAGGILFPNTLGSVIR